MDQGIEQVFSIPSFQERGSLTEGGPAGKTYTLCMLFPGHVLTDHRPFGDGLIAYGFITELARRGHRIHVIAQRTEIKAPLPPNVTIYSIAAKERSIIQRLRFLIRSRAIVRRLLAEEKIDLVQQLNPVCNGMSLGIYGLRVPIVLGTFVGNWPSAPTGNSHIFKRLLEALGKAARLAVLRLQEHQASAFLVTTPAALSRFSSQSRVAGRVHWLPHGIDIDLFEKAPRGVEHRNAILFLANITEKKGIFTLLEAFEAVHAELPDVFLDIAGDGSSFDDVKRHVATMSAASHIRLLGIVTRTMVPQLMADVSLYCLPSFGEPYANTVIEAMACGKPVVVTDSGGLNYMISDEGGRRVQAGNAPELAKALIEILSSRALQEQMGAHNRDVAEREFDWPRVSEKLEVVYEHVLSHAALI